MPETTLNAQEKSYSYGRRATVAQCLTTFVVSITYFENGLMVATPTIIAGNLLNSKHELSLTEEEASWFGGMPFLLQPIGAVAGIFMQDYVGQRYGLCLSNVLALAFFVTLHYANASATILLSSTLMGLSLGFTEPSGMGYISEYSEARLRGRLCSGAFAMMGVGMLFFFAVVSMVDWRTAMLISATVPILSLLLVPWLPDTPIWLLSKVRRKKALKALIWLRGCVTEEDVREEFDNLSSYVKSSLTLSRIIPERTNDQLSVSELMSTVLERRTLYPLLLLSVFHVTYCFAGSIGARVYAMNLFDTLQTPIDKNWLTVSGAIGNVAGYIIVLLVLKYTGKRKLGIATTLLSGSMSICLGVYVYYKDQLQLPWLFISLFFALVLLTALSGPIPWLMMGEIFPVRTRHAGTGLFGAIFDLVLFFFLKIYFATDRYLGTEMYFITNGIFGVIGCVYLYLYLPETENKSLAEIEKIFSKK